MENFIIEPEKEIITELLPQRPPFIMVDRLIAYDESDSTAAAEFRVAAGNHFVKEGHFQPAGLLENMAQTCAARIGYHDKLRHIPIRIGLIGGVKNLHVWQLPKVGDELITSMKVKEEIMDIILAEAVVKDVMQNLYAKAEIKIAIK